jgi:hypothetical protein
LSTCWFLCKTELRLVIQWTNEFKLKYHLSDNINNPSYNYSSAYLDVWKNYERSLEFVGRLTDTRKSTIAAAIDGYHQTDHACTRKT